MNSKEALAFINMLFQENRKPVLNEFEEALFTGIWDNQDYSTIAAKTGYTDQYIREAGTKLFKKIKKDLDITVTKRNFKNPIENRHQKQPHPLPNPPTPTPNPTPHPLQNQPNPTSPPTPHPLLNPFIPQTGRIDNPQQFFNRQREIRKIFEHLNNNSSVVIIGEEGIGKSSLLWMICQQAETQLYSPRQPIFLDLNNGINNEDDFYSALCDEVDIPKSKGYQLTRNLRSHRVLLAIDNVGKLTWNGFTRQIRDHLRGLAEGGDTPLKLILAASEPLSTLFNDSQAEGKTSPLETICQPEIIKPWDEAIIREFMAARLATTSVQFTEAEIRELVQESRGYPKRLMELCYQLFSRYLENE